MVKGKIIEFDVKTKQIKEKEEEIVEPKEVAQEISIDFKALKKLIDYAKSKGWIE